MALVPEAPQPVAETLAEIRRVQCRHIARINEHMHTLNFFSVELSDVSRGVADLNSAAANLLDLAREPSSNDAVDFGRKLNALRMDVGEFAADVTSLRNLLGDLQTSTTELRNDMIGLKQAVELLAPYLPPPQEHNPSPAHLCMG